MVGSDGSRGRASSPFTSTLSSRTHPFDPDLLLFQTCTFQFLCALWTEKDWPRSSHQNQRYFELASQLGKRQGGGARRMVGSGSDQEMLGKISREDVNRFQLGREREPQLWHKDTKRLTWSRRWDSKKPLRSLQINYPSIEDVFFFRFLQKSLWTISKLGETW